MLRFWVHKTPASVGRRGMRQPRPEGRGGRGLSARAPHLHPQPSLDGEGGRDLPSCPPGPAAGSREMSPPSAPPGPRVSRGDRADAVRIRQSHAGALGARDSQGPSGRRPRPPALCPRPMTRLPDPPTPDLCSGPSLLVTPAPSQRPSRTESPRQQRRGPGSRRPRPPEPPSPVPSRVMGPAGRSLGRGWRGPHEPVPPGSPLRPPPRKAFSGSFSIFSVSTPLGSSLHHHVSHHPVMVWLLVASRPGPRALPSQPFLGIEPAPPTGWINE